MTENYRPSGRPAVRPPRPSEVCRQLLLAMEASEGRRQKRKRDTTPDATGFAIKRRLLESVVEADPDPARFEEWLLESVSQSPEASRGASLAMARAILEEWQLAGASPRFQEWLKTGAPSADR